MPLMPRTTIAIRLTIENCVLLILIRFTAVVINTILSMPFTCIFFHVKVIDLNSPGSIPKPDHIYIHSISNLHTHHHTCVSILGIPYTGTMCRCERDNLTDDVNAVCYTLCCRYTVCGSPLVSVYGPGKCTSIDD